MVSPPGALLNCVPETTLVKPLKTSAVFPQQLRTYTPSSGGAGRRPDFVGVWRVSEVTGERELREPRAARAARFAGPDRLRGSLFGLLCKC